MLSKNFMKKLFFWSFWSDVVISVPMNQSPLHETPRCLLITEGGKILWQLPRWSTSGSNAIGKKLIWISTYHISMSISAIYIEIPHASLDFKVDIWFTLNQTFGVFGRWFWMLYMDVWSRFALFQHIQLSPIYVASFASPNLDSFHGYPSCRVLQWHWQEVIVIRQSCCHSAFLARQKGHFCSSHGQTWFHHLRQWNWMPKNSVHLL